MHVGKDEFATLQIKVGDPIRVQFASRWYDAGAAEKWEPKTKKKGKSFVHRLKAFWLCLLNLEGTLVLFTFFLFQENFNWKMAKFLLANHDFACK